MRPNGQAFRIAGYPLYGIKSHNTFILWLAAHMYTSIYFLPIHMYQGCMYVDESNAIE